MIFAGVKGHIDDIAIADVQRFEAALRAHFKAAHPDILAKIRETGALPDEKEIVAAISEVKAGFASGEIVGGTA